DADEAAVVAVGAGVVGGLEAAAIAVALGADDGGAVAAGVEQSVEFAGLVAADDDGAAGDLAGAEIAGLPQLRGVADIDPGAAEDLRHLLAQDLLRHQHLAVEQEGLPLAVIDDVGANRHLCVASRLSEYFDSRSLTYMLAQNRVNSIRRQLVREQPCARPY